MRVVLLAYTPNAERLCCAAAKLCHEKEERDFMEMYEGLSDKHVRAVLRTVLKLGHESVIEHASFTFYIEGVSRALTHQLVRHRIASYSQQSQRHVTLKNFGYVVPDSIKENEELAKRYEDVMNYLAKEYDEFLKKVPKEDARYVLPNACTTKIVVTMNARELRHFFRLRCEKSAQWEIRKLAREMLRLCKEVAPLLFEDIECED
ncbi:MAG: FAD-dependent thymidylate synthase [Thermoplasmata archaeon]|nr:MAG: FAD-dependent thymidylate synthase [Thermoplasmata archaeon]